LLARLKIEDAGAVRFLRAARSQRTRQLVPGRMMRAHTTEDGLCRAALSTGVMMLTVETRTAILPLERAGGAARAPRHHEVGRSGARFCRH
jgi:hypothetical protein